MPINLPNRAHYRSAAVASVANRLTGLAIVTLIPAVFWSFAVLIVADGFYMARTPALILAFASGASAALFLALVCGPLMLQRTR